MNLLVARIKEPAEFSSSPLLRCTTFELFNFGGAWRNRTCQFTFTQHRVSGPGDSRLFTFGGKLYVLFGSRALGLPHECEDPSKQDIVYRQFMAELSPMPQYALQQFSIRSAPVLIDWQQERHIGSMPRREVQKNYSPFVYQDKLYMTYTIVPHVVLSVDPSTGKANVAFNTSGDALAPLSRDFPGADFRGGSAAVLVDLTKIYGATTELRAAYVAVFHFQHPHGHYRHFLYSIEAQPPFAVLSYSCELPLRTLPHYIQPTALPKVAFATGLVVVGDRVLVSYGAGDKEGRIWVGRLSALGLFSHHQSCVEPSHA